METTMRELLIKLLRTIQVAAKTIDFAAAEALAALESGDAKSGGNGERSNG